MKRLTALILSLLLALSALPALAASHPLLEKFRGQLVEQGFKGTVTFAASGDTTTALSADAWSWLKNAAPRVKLEATHSFHGKANGKAVLNLLMDGQTEGRTTLLYNKSIMGVSSDLLGGYNQVWYTAARAWSPAILLQSMVEEDTTWPPVWRLVTAVEGAPEEWRIRASQHLVKYETRLGEWINGYAKISTIRKSKKDYTQYTCTIPAADVKKEISALLGEFYADSALLDLLKEIASPEEAAAYLQPGMQKTLVNRVNKLELTGNVTILRQFDSAGVTVLDQVELPFAAGQAVTSLTIKVEPSGKDQRWTFQGTGREESEFTVVCTAGEDKTYAGSAVLRLPKTESNALLGALPLFEDAGSQWYTAFDYALSWDEGQQEYNLSTDRFLQTVKGSLAITPQNVDLSAQELTLEANFSSASSERSATRIEASLRWQDKQTDASVTVSLSGRTAAPTEVTKLSEVPNRQRVDRMATSAYPGLLKTWRQQSVQWLTELVGRLLPTELSAEQPAEKQ